ncbi:hypothetical protein EDB92DRAFT_1943756 [Lactarius akahatsu]|uniref:Arrestin C-terminal-like domain-containing protein n=1 Tax=Lactarius akahatsu TaxID=416441 RepID=A0AAD4LMF1_9AGAM|nr:hypothetical protein EDB92DRAFT_1943756 [Lactarius akahatsu]
MRDENKLFSATQTFFQAPQSTASRRAISAPGEYEFVGRASSLSPIRSSDSTRFFHLFDPPRGRDRARNRHSVDERNSQSHALSQEDVSMLPAHPLRDDPHTRAWEVPSRPPLGELTRSVSPTSSPIDFTYEGRSFSLTIPSSLLTSFLATSYSRLTPFTIRNLQPVFITPTWVVSTNRERNSPRFSFAGVSNSILEAMRGLSGTSEERGRSRRSGRPSGKGSEGGVLDSDEYKGAGDGWQEFKKGLYTFPISFSIPSYMPPTLSCDYGSVTWHLKANVHRPGIFTPKLSASCEVILVASPNEDREDTAGIAIERTRGDQIRYTLSVSGQMFPIGGSIPITLSFLPMAKVKIYKISVYLEEQVIFFTFESMFRRMDAGRRFELLSLESKDKNSPLLPHPQTVTDSPLYALLGSSDLLPSELAANLMGPGPWTLQVDLKVPNGSRTLHVSNKNRRAPIQISHLLKIVTRVERGDDKQMDPKTGKRKRFDVIMRVPVHILSSLASAQHVALPRYTETQDTPSPPPAPCASWGRGRRHSLPLSRHTFAPESLITAGPLEPFVFPEGSSREVDAQYERSAIFERLITGQQSEAGVVPPAYSPTP